MDRSRAVQVKVGIFVVTAIVIATTLIFVLGSRKGMFGAKTTYHAVFHNVGGLRPGSPLRIAGVDVGQVGNVELRSDGLIHVELRVGDEYRSLVRSDSVVTVGNKGLLGDRLCDITVGRAAILSPGSTVRSEEPGDVQAMLAQASGMIEDAKHLVSNLRTATGVLAEEQFQTDIRSTAHSLSQVMGMAAEGNGTLRRVLTDPSFAQNIDSTLSNLQVASAEFSRTARGVREITDEVRRGDGTAHELIYGDSGVHLMNNLASASGETAQLLAAVRTGDGTVHDLIYENRANDLIDNATQTSADLRAIMADIRAGRGTIGGLLTDPSIYEDIKRLIGDLDRNEILRALVRYSIRRDEAREAPEAE